MVVSTKLISYNFLVPFFLLQDFLTTLVCNLLEEGNTLFKDGEWEHAVREFSEGLSVSCYAAADDVHIPEVLLESLYVNRAAAYHSMVREHFFGRMQRFIQQNAYSLFFKFLRMGSLVTQHCRGGCSSLLTQYLYALFYL